MSPSPHPPPHRASVLGTPWLRCCPRLSPARLAPCHHLFTEAGKIHSPAGGPSAPREGRRQTQEWASRERGSPREQALGAGKECWGVGCVGMGISSCGQGLAGNPRRSEWHGKLLPRAIALEVPSPHLQYPTTTSCYKADLGQCQSKPPCLFPLSPPWPSLNSKCVWALPRACTCPQQEGQGPCLPHLCAELNVF